MKAVDANRKITKVRKKESEETEKEDERKGERKGAAPDKQEEKYL